MGRGRAGEDDPLLRQRLDKWIWFARFQRSRERCAELVRAGHVRVNGRRETSPGAFIKCGDVLTLALPGQTIVVQVLDLAERRGGSAEAEELYGRLEGQSEKVLA
ncbi:MAG: RNA-binding S4 domain-containing protein [Proteobacteria bacterium]|nr:RNA-binding S4 domain-containing protein [Pseudomonadota bacterium]